jgi:pilus assembly protein Flp/PilA
MNTMLLKLYVKFQDLASREEGQDLVEYALVVALIAFGATAGMSQLAKGLNTAFSNIRSFAGGLRTPQRVTTRTLPSKGIPT